MQNAYSPPDLVFGHIPDLNPLQLQLPEYAVIDRFSTRFVAFGSCFAARSNYILRDLGFEAFFDPHTSFHYSPRSFRQSLSLLDAPVDALKPYIAQLKDGTYSSMCHMRLLDTDPDALLEKMWSLNQSCLNQLRQANVVILTLGNATYQKHKTGAVLCHGGGIDKQDYTLCVDDVEQVADDIRAVVQRIREFNAAANVILTVSPQRYGWLMEANLASNENENFQLAPQEATNWLLHSNLDKSKLRLAIDGLLQKKQFDDVFYFPSFEIVMDELRQYESFNHNTNDFLHISTPFTPNYVLNRFLHSFCAPEMKQVIQWFKTIFINGATYFQDQLERIPPYSVEAYLQNVCDGLLEQQQVMPCEALVARAMNAMNHVHPSVLDKLVKQHKYAPLRPFISDVLQQKITDIEAISDSAVVVVNGAGEFLDKLAKHSALLGKQLHCVLSNNAPTANARLFGKPWLHSNTLMQHKADVMVIASERFHDEIAQNAISMGFSGEII